MIMGVIRIVRMEFEPGRSEAFDALFTLSQPKIEGFDGCRKVTLLKSSNEPDVRTTLSWWDHEEALNQYRQSTLFGEIWPATKAGFCSAPLAWTSDWPMDDVG